MWLLPFSKSSLKFIKPVHVSSQFGTSLEYFTVLTGVGTPRQLGENELLHYIFKHVSRVTNRTRC